MPDTYRIEVNGQKYRIEWDRPTPPTQADFESMAASVRRPSATPAANTPQKNAPAPPKLFRSREEARAQNQQRIQEMGAELGRTFTPMAQPGGKIKMREEKGAIRPHKEAEPNAVQKGAAKVGDVLSIPSGIAKAVAQPMDVAIRQKFGIKGRPEDAAEQKRVAALPFIQRVNLLKGQDWRTLGMTPQTQMRRANADRGGNAMEQAFGAVGGFLGDLALDPTTWLAGGGGAVGKKVVGKVTAAKGAEAGAKAAQIASGINRGAVSAFSAQQLATGLPTMLQGAQQGDIRQFMQGALGTAFGALAGAHAVRGEGIPVGKPLPTRAAKRAVSEPITKETLAGMANRQRGQLPSARPAETPPVAPTLPVETPKPAAAPVQPVESPAPTQQIANPRIAEVDPKTLTVDPDRFQYKQNTGEKGIHGKLRKVNAYDPDLGGVLLVWRDPADGKIYVVNGHNRHELAIRSGAESVAVRYIDAPDAATARYKGALANIAEGQGTAIDAAKIFREKGDTPETLKKSNISVTGKVAADGLALSGLDDFLFRQVATGAIPESRGVAIGRYEPDPVRQRALFSLIERAEQKGRKISDASIEDIAQEARTAPVVERNADNLFGEEGAFDESLALDKAELVTDLRAELRRDKTLFGGLANQKKATTLERGQNKINVEENARIAGESSQIAERFDQARRLNDSGIDRLLNEAVVAIANKENKANVKQRLAESVKQHLRQSVPGADATGAGGVPSGRGANAAGNESLFAEPQGVEAGTGTASVPPATTAKPTAGKEVAPSPVTSNPSTTPEPAPTTEPQATHTINGVPVYKNTAGGPNGYARVDNGKPIQATKTRPAILIEQPNREAKAKTAETPSAEPRSLADRYDLERIAKKTTLDSDLQRSLDEAAGHWTENRVAEAVASNPHASDATFKRAIEIVRRDPLLKPGYIEKYIIENRRSKQTAEPAATPDIVQNPPESAKSPVPIAEKDIKAAPKLSEKAHAFLDDLEAGARKRLGGGLNSRIDAGLVDYAIIGAVKIAKKGLDFAAWSAEMVSEFGDKVKPRLAELWQASHDYYNESLRKNLPDLPEIAAPKPIPPGQESFTGAKNATTESERQQRGQSPIERQAYTLVGDAYQKGRAAVESGKTEPRVIAAEVAKKPRPLSAEEVGALAYDRARIIKDYDAATAELAGAVDKGDTAKVSILQTRREQLLEDLSTNDEALVKGGREQSAAFNARKMMVGQDFSFAGVQQRAKAAAERPLSQSESAKLEALTAQLKEKETALTQAEARIKELDAERMIEEATRGEAHRTRQAGRARTREALDKEFASLKEQFVKTASKASSGIDPELLPIVGQMARNRVAAGVNTVVGLVDSIHAELVTVLPDLTKREVQDALSRYGQAGIGRSQSELTKNLNDLKKQERLLSAIEDAESGISPLKGRQPGRPSADVQKLRRRLDDILDAQGIKEKPKWSTDAKQAMRTRFLEAQIADIERRLKVGDYSPRNQKISATPDTPETLALKQKLTKLREQYNAAKPPPDAAAKQAAAEKAYKTRLDKQIADLQERIKTGEGSGKWELPKRPKSPEPSAQVKQLQAQRDRLKAQIEREIEVLRPRTAWEKLAAYQKANLLSSPKGALVDAFSTGVWQMVDNSLMRSLRGSPAEAYHSLRGMAASIPLAVTEGARTFREGYSERQAKRLDLPTHYEMKSIPGKVISAPARVRASINEGQRAIGEGAELYAQAYKTAKAEGSTNLRQRMAELIAEPTEKMQAAMEAYGDEATFTQKPDSIARGINSLRFIEVGGARPFEFVLPFFNTVYNLTKTGIQHTPFGFASLLSKEVRTDPSARRQAVVRAMVGTGAMAMLSTKAQNGEMTGAVPEDVAERAQFFADGKQPYSIKIGNKWVEYKNFGPFVVPMAITAAAWNNYEKKGRRGIKDADILRAAAAMAYVPLEQANMFTLEQLLRSDPNKANQAAGSMASTMVPFSAALRTAGNVTDKWQRDPQKWYQWVQAGMPALREQLPIKTTGREGSKRNIPNPQRGANALLPVQTKQGGAPASKEFRRNGF